MKFADRRTVIGTASAQGIDASASPSTDVADKASTPSSSAAASAAAAAAAVAKAAAVEAAASEHKLFVGMLPRNIDEQAVRSIFSGYGKILEVYIIRDQNGNGRGCAFVKVGSVSVCNLVALRQNITAIRNDTDFSGLCIPLIP